MSRYSTAGNAASPARGQSTVTRMNGNHEHGRTDCETVHPGLPSFIVKDAEPDADGVVDSRTQWSALPNAADKAKLLFDGISASGAPKGRRSVHSVYRTGVVPAVNLTKETFNVGDEVRFEIGPNDANKSTEAYHGVPTGKIVGRPVKVDLENELRKEPDFAEALARLVVAAGATGATQAQIEAFIRDASRSRATMKMVADAVKKAQRGHARVVERWLPGKWGRVQIKRG